MTYLQHKIDTMTYVRNTLKKIMPEWKKHICKAISHVKLEDEEEYEHNIEYMVQDDDYNSPWKIKYATVATGLNAITGSSDSDENPAARKEPITDTQTVTVPIKGSHLGKRVRHSEDG